MKRLFFAALVFCAVVPVLWVGTSDRAHATAQSRRVVTDSVTGYALYGYDPVAFFTDHAAMKGKRVYEYVWQGVSWLFVTRANREVFVANPEIYAPQYGGHGALAMARGYVSGSSPMIWALYRNRLYLFYSYTARAAWAEAIDLHINRADQKWIEIRQQLTR